LRAKRQKLEERVKELLAEQEEEDRKEDDDSTPPDNRSHREKQIDKLKKEADRIEAWLKENGERLGVNGKEIKSNITDNESSLMTTSHGSVQGYNGQAVVDSKHQVIVHGEVFGTGQDADLVPPMIDGTKENMDKIGHEDAAEYFKGKIFTADSVYHSKDNLQKCVDEKLDAYIPDKWKRMRDPGYWERRKQGRTTRAYFAREDYLYNENEDQYICPNGKIMRLQTKHMVSTGNVYRRYCVQEHDCSGCGLRNAFIRKPLDRNA